MVAAMSDDSTGGGGGGGSEDLPAGVCARFRLRGASGALGVSITENMVDGVESGALAREL